MEYNEHVKDLSNVERQHKNNRDPKLLVHIKQLRKQINDLLEQDVEKRARFF